MKKEMLINVLQPEECRIAILEDSVLEELYVERTSHESYVGNIYKGRIVNIEPSIQAAFVDFGVGRNGFLHVSDVEPAYYRHLEQRRDGGRRGNGRDRHRGPARHVEIEEEDLSPSQQAGALHENPEAAVPAGTSEAEAPPRGARPGKERRRGRGSRRRRGRSDEPPRREAVSESAASEPDAGAEVPAPAEPVAEAPLPPTEIPTAPQEAAPPPKPEFMESAERRTEEEDAAESVAPLSVEEDATSLFRSPETGSQAPEIEETESGVQQQLFPAEESPAEGPASQHEHDFEEDALVEEMAEERFNEYEAFEEVDDEPQRRTRSREDRDGRRRGRHNRRGGGRMGMGRPKPLIQDIFRRGQEVLVQVIKEGIGTKGPTLSTYISIAGRYLVLMPGLNRVGVSRKIGDDEQRHRLREIFHELKPPKGLGFIIRTAGVDRNKKELQGDLAYLSRLWQVVVKRIRKLKAPSLIYEESDMITRTIRDTFTSDIDTIWVDEKNAYEHAQEFAQIVMPRYASRIKLYEGSEPLYHRYKIEDEIARIQQRHVPLPHGGSIVIEQTEALVAIDVNSGNFRADNNAEETAYQMNLHAAREIARQLRLRDLGGVIVNDFIDMREEKHRRGVEKALRDAVKRDRARTKILKISAFGIIEMTRQRIRPSLKRSVYQDCEHCLGSGQVKTCESMSIDVMRMLQLAAHREEVQRIQVQVAADVANYLLNKKRKEISRLEESGEIQVHIVGRMGVSPETLDFICYDKNNNEVKFLTYETSRPSRR